MPLYEYKCDSCGVTFEVIQRFSDPPITVCRQCGAPVHKVLSAPAIQFKGSGWYVTDYASKGSAGAATSSNGAGPPASEPSKSSEPASSTPAAASTDNAKKAG